MSPDDPRHGTYAGHCAGCRNDCCRTAARNYHKRLEHDTRNGRPRRVRARGFIRRYQALQRMGWTAEDLAPLLGMKPTNLRRDARARTWISTQRHNQMAAVYDRLSMTVAQGPRAASVRRNATLAGYPSPLAWDNIDTDAHPNMGRPERRDLLAEYRHLTRLGESSEQAVRQLGVTAEAIEQAQRRARKAAA